MTKTIGTEHKKVVDFYRKNADVFSFKGNIGSMKYAFTEIAEAVDARMRSENPDDLRRTVKETDYNAEIGDTMFMLLASIGIDGYAHETFMRHICPYYGRNINDDIELPDTYSTEEKEGVDAAISRAGECIASAMREDPETVRFSVKLANALGSFDWSSDRLDRTIEKLQARCDFKRLELVAAG